MNSHLSLSGTEGSPRKWDFQGQSQESHRLTCDGCSKNTKTQAGLTGRCILVSVWSYPKANPQEKDSGAGCLLERGL